MRTAANVFSDNPEAMEVSTLWFATMLRAFLHRLNEAGDMVDVQVAAGAALQDLDELEGKALYGDPHT